MRAPSSDARSGIYHEQRVSPIRHPELELVDFAVRQAQAKLWANSAEAKDPYDEANTGIFSGIIRCLAPQNDTIMG